MRAGPKPVVLATASLVAVFLGATAVPAATTCEGLANLSLPHGQITTAQTITSGHSTHRRVARRVLPGAPRILVSRNSAELLARRRRRRIRSLISRSGFRRTPALTENTSNSVAAASAATSAIAALPTRSGGGTPPPRRTMVVRREESRSSLWVTPRRSSTTRIGRSKKRPTNPNRL
jgi:hypothetical protein